MGLQTYIFLAGPSAGQGHRVTGIKFSFRSQCRIGTQVYRYNILIQVSVQDRNRCIYIKKREAEIGQDKYIVIFHVPVQDRAFFLFQVVVQDMNICLQIYNSLSGPCAGQEHYVYIYIILFQVLVQDRNICLQIYNSLSGPCAGQEHMFTDI